MGGCLTKHVFYEVIQFLLLLLSFVVCHTEQILKRESVSVIPVNLS